MDMDFLGINVNSAKVKMFYQIIRKAYEKTNVEGNIWIVIGFCFLQFVVKKN